VEKALIKKYNKNNYKLIKSHNIKKIIKKINSKIIKLPFIYKKSSLNILIKY